jgi:hypothetical protein
MGNAMVAVPDGGMGRALRIQEPDVEPGRDLRSLVLDYERRLILDAVSAAGGCQSRAAAALGVLPTTLCEKMKRLGISRRAQGERFLTGSSAALEEADEFRWRGRLSVGRTLEIKGHRGDVRALPATSDMAEVVARRSGKSASAQLAINVTEHEGGAVFSVFTTRAAAPHLTLAPATSALRADFELRVPRGVRLEVRLLSGNIEVAGLSADAIEVSTLSGSVALRGA